MKRERRSSIVFFFTGNDKILKGKFGPDCTYKEIVDAWEVVTKALNACDGPKKNWKEWRKVSIKFSISYHVVK